MEAKASAPSPSFGAAEARAAQPAHEGLVASFASVYRQSLEDAPAQRLSTPVGITPPLQMTAAELAMTLRYTPPAVAPNPARPQPPERPDSAPPATNLMPLTLASGLHWQVAVRSTPLQPAVQAFDGFRARYERAQRVDNTLDVRVTETNRREVTAVPERVRLHGPLTGKRIADAVRSVRRGTTGFADLSGFLTLAQPRLERLRARWDRLAATPARNRVKDALNALSTVVQSAERLSSGKDIAAAQPCEEQAMQVERALLVARGRG